MSFKMTNVLGFLTKNELFTGFFCFVFVFVFLFNENQFVEHVNENVCLVVIARGQMSRKTATFPFSLHRTI